MLVMSSCARRSVACQAHSTRWELGPRIRRDCCSRSSVGYPRRCVPFVSLGKTDAAQPSHHSVHTDPPQTTMPPRDVRCFAERWSIETEGSVSGALRQSTFVRCGQNQIGNECANRGQEERALCLLESHWGKDPGHCCPKSWSSPNP
jgi:hypothetical protein